MANSKMTDLGISSRDLIICAAALASFNLKGEDAAEWEKFNDLNGFANIDSAKRQLRGVKANIQALLDAKNGKEDGEETPIGKTKGGKAPSTGPSTRSKRKKAGGDDKPAAEATPTKKPRGRPKKVKKEEVVAKEEEEGEKKDEVMKEPSKEEGGDVKQEADSVADDEV